MNNSHSPVDPEILKELVSTKMPFGKYKDVVLCDIPVYYLEWFARKGFPKGKLGMQLATLYEIKINGLDYLLKPLSRHNWCKISDSGFMVFMYFISRLTKISR